MPESSFQVFAAYQISSLSGRYVTESSTSATQMSLNNLIFGLYNRSSSLHKKAKGKNALLLYSLKILCIQDSSKAINL
jgi:hypothetical protein